MTTLQAHCLCETAFTLCPNSETDILKLCSHSLQKTRPLKIWSTRQDFPDWNIEHATFSYIGTISSRNTQVRLRLKRIRFVLR